MKDYFKILGIEKTASDEEIKRAYRKLAMQHHPDRGGDQNLFQDINEAYSVLSDPQKKQEYLNPRQQAFFSHGPGFNFDEIFEMFGTNLRGRGTQQSGARISLWISLYDVATGGPRIISLQSGKTSSNIEIDIPKGIEDGDTIRYARLAPDGHDLVVTFRIKPDPTWHKERLNIVKDIFVDVWDIILGREITVTDLLGQEILVKIPAQAQPGTMLRIKGRGLPARNLPGDPRNLPAGDALLKINARIPNEISEELLNAIKKERGQ